MKKIFLLLIFLILNISNSSARSNHARSYGGFEASYIQYNDRNNELANYYTSSYGGKNFVNSSNAITSGRLFFGYKFLKIFDFEIGLSESTNFNYYIYGFTKNYENYEINGTFKYNGLDYSAILRPFYNHELNNFFIRAGGNFYIEKNDILMTRNSINGQKIITNEQNYNYGYGYVLGAGYDFPYRENFDFRLSYNYLYNVANLNQPFNHVYSIGFLNKF